MSLHDPARLAGEPDVLAAVREAGTARTQMEAHTVNLARILVTFVTLVTLIGSNIADWNDTHIFSEMWSPHAHFHGAWFVIAVSLLSLLCLWLVWSPIGQVERSRIAALIQGCIWLAFFPAMLVPDTALADPGKQFGQIAGLELNLVGAVAHVVLLAGALALLHGGAPSRRHEKPRGHASTKSLPK
jgi:hypothetical protein